MFNPYVHEYHYFLAQLYPFLLRNETQQLQKMVIAQQIWFWVSFPTVLWSDLYKVSALPYTSCLHVTIFTYTSIGSNNKIGFLNDYVFIHIFANKTLFDQSNIIQLPSSISGHQQIVQWLLERTDLKQEIDEVDCNQQSALHLACFRGNQKCVVSMKYHL